MLLKTLRHISTRLTTAGLLLSLCLPAAHAQVALESVTNTAVAGSGPAGNGPSAAAQVVTLRHNNNNPTGNTMVARTPAVTATISLTNQQFTGLTPAQGYPASTGGNAAFFGGGAAASGGAPVANPLYLNLGGLGTPQASYFTSVNASAGQGIDLAANAGIFLDLSSNAIAIRAPATSISARVRMVDVVFTFSTPVNDPVVHFGGMGGTVSSPSGQPQLGISAEFDLITAGYSLTRRSGNDNFVVVGNQINNTATILGASCAIGRGACGSVQVNGTGITTFTLRAFLRGDGTSGSTWGGGPGSVNMDGFLIGLSANEPTPTVTVRKLSNGGTGTFNFTGDNGYSATDVTTSVAGTPVAGVTRTLAAAEVATTLVEAPTAGYRLSDITCTGLGSGGSATPTLPAPGVAGGGSVVLSASATRLRSDIVCTFTNEKLPVIRLQKLLPNGRFAASDQFTLRIANGATVLQSATTTGTDNAPAQAAVLNPAAAGTSYTLSEIGAGGATLANYTTTWACANALAQGQVPSGVGASFALTPVAGDDLTCRFTNTARRTDVAIVKSANAATVTSGQNVQFTLLVSNNGAVSADGTQVLDPAVPGLNCSTVTCSAAGGAVCPVSPTVTALRTAPGLIVPTLPAGGSVSLVLTCAVTASGLTP